MADAVAPVSANYTSNQINEISTRLLTARDEIGVSISDGLRDDIQGAADWDAAKVFLDAALAYAVQVAEDASILATWIHHHHGDPTVTLIDPGVGVACGAPGVPCE
jgi:hypothetical protein